MYKLNNDMLPPIFQCYFSLNSDIHNYNTRASNKIHKPSIKTESFKRGIISSGEQLWNQLCNELKQAKSNSTFSKLFKSQLLSKYKI